MDEPQSGSNRPIPLDVLKHYGKKGMKWGVRSGETSGPTAVTLKEKPGKKVRSTGGNQQPASEDARKAAIYKRTAKKSTTDALSTKELTDLVSRMNMEQQYSRLVKGTRDEAGQVLAKRIVKDHGAQSVAVVGGIALNRHPAMIGAKGVKMAVKVATVLAKNNKGDKKKK